MPTKQEVLEFVRQKMDKDRYADYMIYLRESEGEFMIHGKALSAQELVEEVEE